MDDKEIGLRNELQSAIRLRTEAETKASEAKARFDRGAALQEQVEAELNALEASQKEFQSRCERDRTCAVLAAIDGGADDVVLTDVPVMDTGALIPLKTKLAACRTAMGKLSHDLASAKDKANRAAQAVQVIADAIVNLTVERFANLVVATQEEAWRLTDCLKAACTMVETQRPGTTEALQQKVVRQISRYSSAVAETNTLMPDNEYGDYLASKVKTHAATWSNFAKRLTDDADVQFDTGDLKP
jgi:hypothetical protein